jgi:hypothetical protein
MFSLSARCVVYLWCAAATSDAHLLAPQRDPRLVPLRAAAPHRLLQKALPAFLKRTRVPTINYRGLIRRPQVAAAPPVLVGVFFFFFFFFFFSLLLFFFCQLFDPLWPWCSFLFS